MPFGQPALALAAQLQRRAERSGVPAELVAAPGDEAGAASVDAAPGDAAAAAPGGEAAAAPVGEAAAPGGEGAALGEQLFLLVARARAAGLDPELELRAASRRYRHRVRAWERSQPPGRPALPPTG